MRSGALLFLLSACSTFAATPTLGLDTARAIREAGLDPEACYRVRDLNFSKEDIKLYFNDGYLIFAKPVRGERLAVVFSGEMEGGDGELLLLPPTRAERQSLAKFTKSPNLDEHFRTTLFLLTDGGGNALLDRIRKEDLGRKAPEMAPLLAEQWNSVIANVSEGFTIRLLEDLLNPVRSSGFFLAAMMGRQLGSFDVLYDPKMPEQIIAAQLSDHAGRTLYDVWTSFPARSFRGGAAPQAPAEFAADQYQIQATLDTNLRMKAMTRARIKVGPNGVLVLPFEISRAMQVRAARIDGNPAELIIRESERGRALHPGQNDTFLVLAPEPLAPGSIHQIEFEHEGNVIDSPGKGIYYVGARANWYPSIGDTLSTFDLMFRYPRQLTLVTAGDIVDDHVEGEVRITRRQTSRIRIAGFNLGEYEKFTGDAPGYSVEVYGNRALEPSLRPAPQATILVDPARAQRTRPGGINTIIQTPPSPDPLGRLKAVANDVAASLQYYSGILGPPPLKTLTVAPIPDTFGQGFPGLIYLSTLAYLNAEERPASARGNRQQIFYSDMIQAHETAHQWWGNLIAPQGYQDEWLMEALAQYSALLWLEKKKGTKALEDVLEDYREDLLKQDDAGRAIESAGPLTWGYRLDATPLSEAWRAITYEKGAWVMHMLRKRVGDARFLKMLGELRKRHEFKSVSTRDFQALVKEFLPPKTSPDSIDTFFDNWVYSTGVPTLRIKFSQKNLAPNSVRVTGTVEQSGVDADFSVDVPVEIQFLKGAPQTIWVRTSNDSASFAATFAQPPARVIIPARGAVLAVRK